MEKMRVMRIRWVATNAKHCIHMKQLHKLLITLTQKRNLFNSNKEINKINLFENEGARKKFRTFFVVCHCCLYFFALLAIFPPLLLLFTFLSFPFVGSQWVSVFVCVFVLLLCVVDALRFFRCVFHFHYIMNCYYYYAFTLPRSHNVRHVYTHLLSHLLFYTRRRVCMSLHALINRATSPNSPIHNPAVLQIGFPTLRCSFANG